MVYGNTGLLDYTSFFFLFYQVKIKASNTIHKAFEEC